MHLLPHAPLPPGIYLVCSGSVGRHPAASTARRAPPSTPPTGDVDRRLTNPNPNPNPNPKPTPYPNPNPIPISNPIPNPNPNPNPYPNQVDRRLTVSWADAEVHEAEVEP